MTKNNINSTIKSIINERGLILKKVAEKTGIEYQRLNRLFNQNATMSASELISICSFLGIDPMIFAKAA